ncbi:hypothetical protein [Mycobacterium sp. SMC-4]|uniref:hypothetical protein n=1 Tax=Mycobacterium sp. SMC-4 TaxID=2857059 RepID=UPI003D008EB0
MATSASVAVMAGAGAAGSLAVAKVLMAMPGMKKADSTASRDSTGRQQLAETICC